MSLQEANPQPNNPAIEANDAPPAPPVNRTLFEILLSIEKSEQVLELTGKPAPLTKQDMIDLKAKMDGYRHVIRKWEVEAAGWNGQIEFIEKELKHAKDAQKALLNKAEARRQNIVRVGQFFGFEILPGNTCSFVIKRGSKPSTKFLRDATALDYREMKATFPGLVEKTPASYDFDTDEYLRLHKMILGKLDRIAKKVAEGVVIAADDPDRPTPAEEQLLGLATLKYKYRVEAGPAPAKDDDDVEG